MRAAAIAVLLVALLLSVAPCSAAPQRRGTVAWEGTPEALAVLILCSVLGGTLCVITLAGMLHRGCAAAHAPERVPAGLEAARVLSADLADCAPLHGSAHVRANG